MEFDFQMEHHDRYTIVRVQGRPSVQAFLSFVDLMAVESASWTHKLALFDMRAVETLKPFTEQFAIGEAVIRCLGHLDKIASLVPEGRITGTSQKVARRAGIDLRVFADEAEAITWLLAIRA